MDYDNFMEIATILSNPTAYTKKINELKAYDKSIKDNMDATVDISKLTSLLASAEIALAQAKDVKAKAAVQAAKTIADSTVVFNERHSNLAAQELAAGKAVAEYNRIVLEQAAKESSYREQEKTLAEQARSISEQKVAIAIQQAELTERLDKLRSVMG